MKKSLLIFILVIVLCFSACSKDNAEKGSEETEEKATITETVKIAPAESEDTTKDIDVEETDVTTESAKLPLNQEKVEFSFLSGAGGWRTVMHLNSDGTFTGEFSDSELGSTGEGYPNGTYYISEFSGNFVNIKKINDYTYSMELADLKLEKAAGEEWIEDGILYIAADAYGIEPGKEFIFYTADAPISEMNEEFLMWWPYRFENEDNSYKTLSCYGIQNVSTNDGFFNLK